MISMSVKNALCAVGMIGATLAPHAIQYPENPPSNIPEPYTNVTGYNPSRVSDLPQPEDLQIPLFRNFSGAPRSGSYVLDMDGQTWENDFSVSLGGHTYNYAKEDGEAFPLDTGNNPSYYYVPYSFFQEEGSWKCRFIGVASSNLQLIWLRAIGYVAGNYISGSNDVQLMNSFRWSYASSGALTCGSFVSAETSSVSYDGTGSTANSTYGLYGFGSYTSAYYVPFDGMTTKIAEYLYNFLNMFLESYYLGGETAYNAGFEDMYEQAVQYDKANYINGYNAGYYQGRDDSENAPTESAGITDLFGAIIDVPFNVLNGLTSFTIWDISIIAIAITVLMVLLILWLVRRLV